MIAKLIFKRNNIDSMAFPKLRYHLNRSRFPKYTIAEHRFLHYSHPQRKMKFHGKGLLAQHVAKNLISGLKHNKVSRKSSLKWLKNI